MFILLIFFISTACRGPKELSTVERGKSISDFRLDLCQDGQYKVLKYNNIAVSFLIDNEEYSGSIDLIYFKDSCIYLSVVSTGFEFIRGFISSDSVVLINRIEKSVYKKYFNHNDIVKNTVFNDLVSLFVPSEICSDDLVISRDSDYFLVNKSDDFYIRHYYFSLITGALMKSELVERISGAYVLTEKDSEDKVNVYLDYFGFLGKAEFISSLPELNSGERLSMTYSKKYTEIILE